MRRYNQRIHKLMDRSFAPFRGLPTEEAESVGARVLERLRTEADRPAAAVPVSTLPVTMPWRFPWPTFALVAVAITIAVFLPSRVLRGAPAILEDGAGSRRIQYGEIISPQGTQGGTLKLKDGSQVEMRSESELSLERTNEGVRLNLIKGDVIVSASERLAIVTKDVSAVGKIFLVNTNVEGSRVAVIDGELRVQGSGTQKTLRPGEQLVSDSLMEMQPVQREISWSRNAESHVALLQNSARTTIEINAGSVTGIVRTFGGSAASGIRVGAMRTDGVRDELRTIVSLAETDSSGRYRLENIPTGSYYITAGRVNLPTYYPGTLELAKGTPVSITASATLPGIDIVLQEASSALPPRTHAVRGLVFRRPDFSAIPRNEQSANGRRVRSREDQPAGFVATEWTDEDLKKRLGLTEDQMGQIAAIADQYLQVFLHNKSNFEREETILKRMVEPDSKEPGAAVSLQNERVLGIRKVWEDANSKTVQEILHVLSESQRQQLQTEMFTGQARRLGGLTLEEFGKTQKSPLERRN